MLTISNLRDYAFPAAEHSAVGFDSPEIGGQPPHSGFFTSVSMALLFLGVTCGEPSGSPVLSRSVNPHVRALPFDSGKRDFETLDRSITMCQCTPTPVPGKTSIQPPAAWYDLSGRVSAARAVASCALDSLPNGLQGIALERANHLGNLVSALQDLLDLCEQDVSRLESQLKGA